MLRKKSFSSKEVSRLDLFIQWWRFRHILRFLKEGSVVCDLGCGTNGDLLHKISKTIKEGVGVDCYVSLDKCDEKIKLIEADLEKKIPLQEEHFDLVFSLAVIEHLNDSMNLIKEAKRLLKDGGMLVLTTPTPYAKFILEALSFIGLISSLEIKDHKHYYTMNELEILMKVNGLKIVKMKKFQLGLNNLIVAIK